MANAEQRRFVISKERIGRNRQAPRKPIVTVTRADKTNERTIGVHCATLKNIAAAVL